MGCGQSSAVSAISENTITNSEIAENTAKTAMGNYLPSKVNSK